MPTGKPVENAGFSRTDGACATGPILPARGKFCRVFNAALTMPGRVEGRRQEGRDHAHPGTRQHRGRRAASPRGAPASGTFSLEAGSPARAAGAAAGVRNIGGIDALLALQGVEEPGERRKKAVRRGRGALDALDALKIGLLSGTLDTGALARLNGRRRPGRADRRPGARHRDGRDRAARRGRTGQDRHARRKRPGNGLSPGSICPNRAALHVFHVERMTDFAVVGRAADGYKLAASECG